MERQIINGFLLLDKPAEMTSNRALQTVKRLFNAKKAGFLGTLDPFATGMLPICFGRATKQVEVLHQNDKTYRALIQLGERTTTGDPEGAVAETLPIPHLTESQVAAAMQKFIGEIDQVPPIYSALKKEGVPLYKLARQGIEVERLPRKVWVASLKLIALTATTLEFEVVSGKGFYVRVLAEDLARALGTCGHLIALRRLACGGFDHQPMHPLSELEALRDQAPQLEALLLRSD
jgi:tRNA pseudouridine55 synthase